MIACIHSLSFHLVTGVEVNNDKPHARIQCKSDTLQLYQGKHSCHVWQGWERWRAHTEGSMIMMIIFHKSLARFSKSVPWLLNVASFLINTITISIYVSSICIQCCVVNKCKEQTDLIKLHITWLQDKIQHKSG